MFRATFKFTLAMALIASAATLAWGCYHMAYVEHALATELNEDGSFDQKVIDDLRRWGYEGLDELRERETQLRTQLVGFEAGVEQRSVVSKKQQAEVERLKKQLEKLGQLIDQVGGQRYCTTSGLFWHTDLKQALKESASSKKPVLSLRMLGKLTDEYSCANSRFFRTTLYSNATISKNLRENFVLHWKSVRPVPRITIDFGDGRVLERTITGNSAHYLLDSTGRPLDCLPGLHGPGAFTEWLEGSKQVAKKWATLEGPAKQTWLVQYHKTRNQQLSRELQRHMRSVDPGFGVAAKGKLQLAKSSRNGVPPHAMKAARVASSKLRVEQPILMAFQAGAIDEFEKGMNDERWTKLAALHAGSERLDEKSVALIRRENPSAVDAAKVATSKFIVEDPLVRLVQNFQNSILLDTVRNKYLLHRRIHSWFEDTDTADVETLNRRVYTELFLTPDTDPWLGLKPSNVYTALENDGITIAAKK